jgi:hypothetical protein
MTEGAPKNPGALTEAVAQLYRDMARDPVTFFNARPAAKLNDIIVMLRQLRERASLPQGDPGRLNLKRSETDQDLVRYTVESDSAIAHYEGLFRIVRRSGFDVTDCITILMQNLDLQKMKGDVGEWSALLEAARSKVESDDTLPPVTKRAAFTKIEGN